MDTPTQILTTAECRVFTDKDGYELVEIGFSNGSTVLMHYSQYHAIAYGVASSTTHQGHILDIHESMVRAERKRENIALLKQATDRQKIG